ncbi:MAG: hypothetical protein KAX78_09205 [Phycisphaerae bacterium]|nr:hypothetical protein [Phycisphaerae bacterium]
MSDENIVLNNTQLDTAEQDQESFADGQGSFDTQSFPKPSAVNRSNIVLAVLFAAGIGTVYLLSQKSGPAPASASQQAIDRQVDVALARLAASGKTKETKEEASILATLHYKISDRQIPIGRLSGNPFVFGAPGAATMGPLGGLALTKPGAAKRTTEQTDAVSAVKELQLQCILSSGSREPVAIISDHLLREGQTIEGWNVKQIHPRSVLLTWKNRTHTLELPKPNRW